MNHYPLPRINDAITRAIKLKIISKKQHELIAKLGEHLFKHSTGNEKALLKMTDTDFRIFIEQAKRELNYD